ncbi:unnamed protein product [Hydatigera taeniaeformis]|uniref:Na_Ca_ex domain-containing protein n=1 Tax=Hydatigena taeniaeformis TaxID=6205 RepID=A0A0R3WQQ2_HYDTA|nr:unnamed protein product [Hydatigera taeniaeformis]
MIFQTFFSFLVISWFVSPLLSGFVSTFIFFIVKKLVLTKEHPLEPGLNVLPFFYGATVLINIFSVLYGGLSIFGISEIKLWIVLVASFGAGILTGLIVFFFVRPYLRRKILHRLSKMEDSKEGTNANLKETAGQKFRRHMLGILLKLKHPRQSSRCGESSPDFVCQRESPSIDIPPVQVESLTLGPNVKTSAPPETLITDLPSTNQDQHHEGGETNIPGPGEDDDDSSITEVSGKFFAPRVPPLPFEAAMGR